MVGAPAEAASAYFKHGLASGDPTPTAVVLWTRLTPTSTSTPGSGKGPSATVTWHVATDQKFTKIVKKGTFATSASRDHTVKLDVTGLKPATTYWYRFSHKGSYSPVARTRTAPAYTANLARMRFGIVSCANLQAGWFNSYRHLAARSDLDAILHLGDYLYEYGNGEFGNGISNTDIRKHVPAHETLSLKDYRQRHGQYKQDPDLASLHRRFPFIITWDDHETANDTWTEGAENHDASEGSWKARRAASLKAYDEWMPVRLSGTSKLGDGTQIYRRFQFGNLIDLSMLDLRSYRNAPGAEFSPAVGVSSDPKRTIAGATQLGWLQENLATTKARWKFVGNPVMISPVLIPPLPEIVTNAIEATSGLVPPGILPTEGVPYNTDQWDGYLVERKKLTDFIKSKKIQNIVFLTGDIHSAWACDIPADKGLYPLGGSIATELVTTSVTSNNLDDLVGVPPRTTSIAVEAAIQTVNRHVRYLNFDDHGYSVLDVTPARVQMDYFIISDRIDPKATSARTASWVIASGTQKVKPSATGIA